MDRANIAQHRKAMPDLHCLIARLLDVMLVVFGKREGSDGRTFNIYKFRSILPHRGGGDSERTISRQRVLTRTQNR